MYHVAHDLAEYHRQDLLREAAQLRLAEQVYAGSHKRSLQDALLAWLGLQLIAWGWRLRARYGAVEHKHAA